MGIDKSLLAGSTAMLVLKLLEERDLYGYEMIEALAKRSDDTFSLKAGTLYPLLHGLEDKGFVTSYEKRVETGKVRKYYSITEGGRDCLREKEAQWDTFSRAVGRVLRGGESCAVFG